MVSGEGRREGQVVSGAPHLVKVRGTPPGCHVNTDEIPYKKVRPHHRLCIPLVYTFPWVVYLLRTHVLGQYTSSLVVCIPAAAVRVRRWLPCTCEYSSMICKVFPGVLQTLSSVFWVSCHMLW